MKKEEIIHQGFKSINELHEAFGLPKPVHPLISLIDNTGLEAISSCSAEPHVLTFYKISYKANSSGKLKYGQDYYDFNEGGLMFAQPGQIIGRNENGVGTDRSYYTLLIHPDFLWNYPLAKKIKQYGFFSYSANEALHLSEKEKETIIGIFKIIQDELSSRIDDFSQDVIISQIELLFNYANRFYKRQFITRKAANHSILQKLEELLDDYFSSEKAAGGGLPTVQYLSGHLNISPSYLSDMLRSLTGLNAQQHIHLKLVEKAKEKLSATDLTVAQVAYDLGFEHPQSFSKFFKTKTNSSPLEFRRSFN